MTLYRRARSTKKQLAAAPRPLQLRSEQRIKPSALSPCRTGKSTASLRACWKGPDRPDFRPVIDAPASNGPDQPSNREGLRCQSPQMRTLVAIVARIHRQTHGRCWMTQPLWIARRADKDSGATLRS